MLLWFLWANYVQNSNFPSPTCYMQFYGCIPLWHLLLPSMTCISVFYDIVLSTKWCASLPFMTCCLWWLVWLPHMTPYSFKVYISRLVWFEFERIKTLKAIGCKVYDMLLGFLWLPSMTSMTVWFLWVKKIQSSNSRGNFVPMHICFYDCTHIFLCYVSRTDASKTITMGFYDVKIQISIFSRKIFKMDLIWFKKNVSNLVVKTICELDIWVKNYREKTKLVLHAT